MGNEQLYCGTCGVLTYDHKQGINKPRHSVTTTFGYSSCGTWGYREDAIGFDSHDGLCDECFKKWWELAMTVRSWLGLRPIKPKDRR